MTRRFSHGLLTIFGLFLWTCLFLQSTFAVDPSSARWVPLKAKNSPSARAASAMAYDPVSQKIILFGGFDYANYLNETWIFDGLTWTKLNTPTAPSGRAASNMAYDKVSKKLVLFGGYDGNRYLNETWLWDGATMLLETISKTFLHEATRGSPHAPDDDTCELWRRRYFAALRTLRQAGVQTVDDEQAGAEYYVNLRRQWNDYLTHLGPMLVYTTEDIDPVGYRAEMSDERQSFGRQAHTLQPHS